MKSLLRREASHDLPAIFTQRLRRNLRRKSCPKASLWSRRWIRCWRNCRCEDIPHDLHGRILDAHVRDLRDNHCDNRGRIRGRIRGRVRGRARRRNGVRRQNRVRRGHRGCIYSDLLRVRLRLPCLLS